MNLSTLLHRQVNPAWVQSGRATSQAFRPMLKDNKMLSVYDGDLITAANSWHHFTATLGYSSVGVLAVTVEECESLTLSAIPDPAAFPEHVLIDFTAHAEKTIVTKSKLLRARAEVRGWQFRGDLLV